MTSGSLQRAATVSEYLRSNSARASIEACTRWSLAEETIFIAEVIFSVLCTEDIRAFNSFRAAMTL